LEVNTLNIESHTALPSAPDAKAPALPPENGRWAGYVQLMLAREKEMWREPEVIFWVFVFPILLALGLGIAFRNRPPEVHRVAIVAADKTSHALDLLGPTDTHPVAIVAGPETAHALDELLKASREKGSIHADVLSEAQALDQFRLGKYDLVLIPKTGGGFEFRYDPARPESVLARATVNDALQAAAGRKDALPTSQKASSEPGARYIDFLIPGLLGMNLMNSGMWGIGFALVEMRQRKLLKRFVATPMRRSDFLLALASSRLLLMLVELALLLGFGVLAFQMRVMGSWASVILISAVGALCFGGLGLLTASRAQKIETVSGLINLVMMPMWLFSGVFFSYERFPAILLPLIKLLPLTALNDALRATILEGASLAAQGTRLLVLLLWGGVSYLLALRWFRWT
jgi:ABC-type multidrug transport system permease subunit